MSFLSALFGPKKSPPPPPKDPGAPTKKPNRFRRDADSFAARCTLWTTLLAKSPADKPTGHVAVVVSPWISTPVPFFALECALALRQTGLHVTLLWDSTEIVGNVPNKKHVDVIASVFPALPPGMQIVDISAAGEGTPPTEADTALATRIVYENAVRNVRGEMNVETFFAAHPEAEADTRAHFARIRQTLAGLSLDWLLVPGGIFGVSAVYVEIARELGLHFSTFDSGPGRLRVVHDGVAAHLADLPRAFEIMNAEMSDAQKARGRELAFAEMDRRTQGSDDRNLQVTPATGAEHRCDILIPLNIRWDSAALSRQRLFASVEESIAAVLDWAAAKPGVTVCIRQHPSERRDHMRGSDNWQHLKDRFAHMGERARWIAATDPVNTYDLIRVARAVLPHTSTVGIEAALLGRPVILSTRVYYGAFSFVWNPSTREEFFALLEQSLTGGLFVTESAKAEAALAYFITQQCSVLRTRFTPQNDDYVRWIETPPDTLWQEPEPHDFLTAMLTREPLPALRARRILAA